MCPTAVDFLSLVPFCGPPPWSISSRAYPDFFYTLPLPRLLRPLLSGLFIFPPVLLVAPFFSVPPSFCSANLSATFTLRLRPSAPENTLSNRAGRVRVYRRQQLSNRLLQASPRPTSCASQTGRDIPKTHAAGCREPTHISGLPDSTRGARQPSAPFCHPAKHAHLSVLSNCTFSSTSGFF